MDWQGRLRNWGVALATAMAVLLAAAGQANACRCAQSTPRFLIGLMPVIVTGTVLDVRRTPINRGWDELAATIAVAERWKGSVADRITVYGHTATNVCGYSHFPVGQTITLFLSLSPATDSRPAGFSAGGCSAVGAVSLPAAWLKLLQDFREEQASVDAALRATPASPAALLARAAFLERWEDEVAAQAYAELAARTPDLLAAHLGLARTLFRKRRYADARVPLGRAEALAPTDPETIRLNLQLRLHMGETAALDSARNVRGLVIPHLDWSGRDLRNRSLAGADVGYLVLAGADLRGADLQGLSSSSAHLGTARLDGAQMAGVRLPGATLIGASLRRVAGPDASFLRADLTGAALDGASLPGANLRGAKLINVSFGTARLVGANLAKSDLAGADLSRADIRGADFAGAFYDCRTRLPRGVTPDGLGMVLGDPQAPPCGGRAGQ